MNEDLQFVAVVFAIIFVGLLGAFIPAALANKKDHKKWLEDCKKDNECGHDPTHEAFLRDVMLRTSAGIVQWRRLEPDGYVARFDRCIDLKVRMSDSFVGCHFCVEIDGFRASPLKSTNRELYSLAAAQVEAHEKRRASELMQMVMSDHEQRMANKDTE